jgi:hypothetical protein
MLAAAKYIGVVASKLIGAGKVYYNLIINLISFDLSYLKMIQQNLIVMSVKLFRIVQFIQKIKNEYTLYYINKYSGGIQHSILFGLILEKLKLMENGHLISGNNSQANLYINLIIITLICLLNVINLLGYIISIYLIKKYDIETKFPKLKSLIKYFGKSSLIFNLFEGIMCIFLLSFMIITFYNLLFR